MIKNSILTILNAIGIDKNKRLAIIEWFNSASIKMAVKQQGLSVLIDILRKIEPDISGQEYSGKAFFNDYWELKRRALQSFQVKLMLKAVENLKMSDPVVVDIGDSAGTHMLYLKELTKDKYNIETISVNLDKEAIDKIKARGFKAILSRAEDLDLGGKQTDLFTSFQMIEHLHNPAIFLRRLAKRTSCRRMLVTLPYMKRSRVGTQSVRNNSQTTVNAEMEHIFELSPEDWKLLMLHSGWRVVHEEIFYQYPARIPFLRAIFAAYWARTDFEGFWGAIMEKDLTYSDRYKDWEE